MTGGATSNDQAEGGRQLWARWLGRGTAAIADQGLFAGGNFLLNVLLARWLTPDGYGAFSIAFSIFLLIGTVHTALLTEPMLVFGPSKSQSGFTSYLAGLIRLHWLGTILVGFLLLGTAAVTVLAGASPLAATIVALSPTVPLVLLTWLTRRACYVSLQPHLAALGGVAYLVAMLGLLAVLKLSGLAAPSTALLAMGAASGAALAVLLPRLHVSPFGVRPIDGYSDISRDHWRYGRWALGTSLLAWVLGNMFVLVLPLNGGLEAVGEYRALVNLFVPMMQVTSALGILVLPILVRAREQPADRYSRVVRYLALGFAAGAALYGLAVATWGTQILDWLYAGRYTEQASTLWLLAGVPVCAGVSAVLGSALRALERPELVFRAYVLPTFMAVTAGTLLVMSHGVSGASLGWLGTCVLAASGLAVQFHWVCRRAHHTKHQRSTSSDR